MSKKENVIVRIPGRLHIGMLNDLRRSHPFAFERVGFLFTRTKMLADGSVLLLAVEYVPIEDEDYIEDNTVGAKIGSVAIRKAMQHCYDLGAGCFHVHLHDHRAKPSPSHTDNKSLPRLVKSFMNITDQQANGILILSEDSAFSMIQLPGTRQFSRQNKITIVSFPMSFLCSESEITAGTNIYSRQSFLGEKAQEYFSSIKVVIAGYGGGGSHIGQQCAHLGIKNPVVFDSDILEDSNLNRLIGGEFRDIKKRTSKINIARRIIKQILPSSKPVCVNVRWQEKPELLQAADIVVGCVDSYAERQQLEAECRRYLIPYIDIGMDVYVDGDDAPSISGQVILSMPDKPCMWCFGFLTERKLGLEAAKYGNTGGRPQIVWSNGVLASAAIGVLVELVTGWTRRKEPIVYLEYDGSKGLLRDHIRGEHCPDHCTHYPLNQMGPTRLVSL
jgi:hypothetical protein